MRRALILSGRFGKGHDVVAEACAAALEPLDTQSRIVDSIELLGGAGSAAGDWVFRRLLSVNPIYDAFHFSQLRVGGALARGLDTLALRTMYPRFLAETQAWPPDLLISVFATGAAAAARYQLEQPGVRTVVVMTDSYAHRLWVHEGTDLFVVTSHLAECSVRRYRPRAHIAVVSAPARPAFYRAPLKPVAREALGVPADAACVLLMSGAWGIGPLDEAAAGLARAGYCVLAVAGSNAKLANRLRAVARDDTRVVAFGFTDRVPELMAAADVVVTSSGDTCTEARVVGRPLVLLDVVPGHGRENLMHELERGNAVVASAEPGELVASVEAFLEDGARDSPPVTSPAGWQRELREALAGIGFP